MIFIPDEIVENGDPLRSEFKTYISVFFHVVND